MIIIRPMNSDLISIYVNLEFHLLKDECMHSHCTMKTSRFRDVIATISVHLDSSVYRAMNTNRAEDLSSESVAFLRPPFRSTCEFVCTKTVGSPTELDCRQILPVASFPIPTVVFPFP